MRAGTLLRYEPRLIEEAVFLALREHPDGAEFRRFHDRVYEIADADERERQFAGLHTLWFNRLGLGKTLEQAIAEQPSLGSSVEACFILRAIQTKQEGAELFVAPANGTAENTRRTLRILLRPESLQHSASLRTFLRCELMHITDMLDPKFAYQPVLPKAPGGPTYDSLVTNRYRVLWDITVVGRMHRLGWVDETVRERLFADFYRAFPMLDGQNDDLFNQFFHWEEPRHPRLAAFAFAPRSALASARVGGAPGTHCPLCRFPTHVFEPEPNRLDTSTLAAISRDFPEWTPALGLCAQCAEIYRANRLSDAPKTSPGVRTG